MNEGEHMAHARSDARVGPSVPELVAVLGGAMLGIGSFLTWISASISLRALAETLGMDVSALQGANIPSRVSATGIDLSDGKITLFAGILVLIGIAIAYVVPRWRIPAVVLVALGGSAGAARALSDLRHVDETAFALAQRLAADLGALGFTKGDVDRIASSHAELGVWLCLAGGVVSLVGGLMLARGVLVPAGEPGSGEPAGPSA